ILKRQDSVAELVASTGMRTALAQELGDIGDLERLISKICTGRATPREVIYVKITLRKIPRLAALLSASQSDTLVRAAQQLNPLTDVEMLLSAALSDDPP